VATSLFVFYLSFLSNDTIARLAIVLFDSTSIATISKLMSITAAVKRQRPMMTNVKNLLKIHF